MNERQTAAVSKLLEYKRESHSKKLQQHRVMHSAKPPKYQIHQGIGKERPDQKKKRGRLNMAVFTRLAMLIHLRVKVVCILSVLHHDIK